MEAIHKKPDLLNQMEAIEIKEENKEEDYFAINFSQKFSDAELSDY